MLYTSLPIPYIWPSFSRGHRAGVITIITVTASWYLKCEGQICSIVFECFGNENAERECSS